MTLGLQAPVINQEQAPSSSQQMRPRAPWYFRVGKYFSRKRYRGGHRILETALHVGLLNASVLHQITDCISFEIPLNRKDNWWDESDLFSYERAVFERLAGVTKFLPAPVTLIDCGADIGLFSALCVARCPEIRQVHAFEPNWEAHRWLGPNLRRLPIPAAAHLAAVGDSLGKGTLSSPDYDSSEHAKYVAPSLVGEISITTIDALGLDTSGGLILKADVEGSELNVLRGARSTIARAPKVAVVLEAHPLVVQRTRVDPIECLRFLQSVRTFDFQIAELPNAQLRTDRPFFEQAAPVRVYNVLGLTIR